MPQYTPPLRDMRFVLHEMLNVTSHLQAMPSHAEVDASTIDAVLEEGGKFAAQVVFPLNRSGDEEGCTLDRTTHEVRVPGGYQEAYDKYVSGGWPGLSSDPAHGGQGLPTIVSQCIDEMLTASSQAWTMYPILSRGAYACLHAHGTPEQKSVFLPRLVRGEWAGTMCLTEPHCGTDLGLLRTKAEPLSDGTFGITGQKIFISAGEHGMAENILHLVLARLPGAPAGSKGISLFLVPKFHVSADGSLGERNGVHCTGLEHKMGIHGNSTCQMTFEKAVGTLVGQPNRGLQAMFVMMNGARMAVGNQSLGLTEVAYQNAAAYAKDRLQMRGLSGPKAPDKPADPIIVHPDVRRMLLTARAFAEGGRALALFTALQIDREKSLADDDARKEAAELVALLIPIVKAFVSDNAWIATTQCQAVFGGHGYIREWGMEQYVRDARISMIYEGTNTIQSLDLLGRKVLADGGKKLRLFGGYVRALIEEQSSKEEMREFIEPLMALGDEVVNLTADLGKKAMSDPDEVGAGAVDYLRICGHWVFSYFWARIASVALSKLDSGDPFYTAKLHTARFYFAKLLPETAGLIRSCRAGLRPLMAMDEALF